MACDPAAAVRVEQPLIPGLQDDEALLCLAHVPRVFHKTVRSVCRSWKTILDFPGRTGPAADNSTCELEFKALEVQELQAPAKAPVDADEVSPAIPGLQTESCEENKHQESVDTRHKGTLCCDEQGDSRSLQPEDIGEAGLAAEKAGEGPQIMPPSDRTASLAHQTGGLVQKGALYQMRQAQGLAETWIYVRTRTSAFINNWHYFDVTNRVWAPKVPEIPYIAAAVAERTEGGAFSGRDLTPVSEMNKVRGLGSAAVGPRIFVFGGWREGGPALPNMFCYDAISERWTRRANMLSPRCYMASAVIGSKIYVAGGMSRPRLHQSELLTSAEVYDTQQDTWQRLPDMPFAMFFSCAAAIGGQLFVSGTRPPCDFGPPGRGCILDPVSLSWTPMFDKKLGDVMLSPSASVGPWLFAVSTTAIQAWDSRDGSWHVLSMVLEPATLSGSSIAGLGTAAEEKMDLTRVFQPQGQNTTSPAVDGFSVKHAKGQAESALLQKQMLVSALKDCVFMGRLPCTSGCEMILLQRTGGITRVRIDLDDGLLSGCPDYHVGTTGRHIPHPALLSGLQQQHSERKKPIISRVCKLSVAPPLEDEQPVDMALIAL